MKQQTLKKNYSFEGKGLHTGCPARLTLRPAEADSGIRFFRTDLGSAEIPALAKNVSSTARSTTLSCGEASVSTVEHLLSALTGLGVDNVRIELEGPEVPILDGSALPYVEAVLADGLQELSAERRMIVLPRPVEIRYENTGSWVRITPAESLSYELTVDFGSHVLGVQTACWDGGPEYAGEIAPCRTFCFFHELEFLASQGLVKGGDVDNAIVIVEHPVSEEQLERMRLTFGQRKLGVTPEGYLSNLKLRFPNECGRHKLLDLIGDLRLVGGFLQARIEAYKPGHGINTQAAKAVLNLI
ncbi:MAG: UDP-3-O-[Bacteroidales bacterium]|nr:UDP-3-O-[3-hydroxymyristoyl] N-acetylglucosamine deacetylase [Bacteroidales bacterium]